MNKNAKYEENELILSSKHNCYYFTMCFFSYRYLLPEDPSNKLDFLTYVYDPIRQNKEKNSFYGKSSYNK